MEKRQGTFAMGLSAIAGLFIAVSAKAQSQVNLVGMHNLKAATQVEADHGISHLFDGCVVDSPACTTGSYRTNVLRVEFDLGAVKSLSQVALHGDAEGSWVSQSFDFEYKVSAADPYLAAFKAKPARVSDWVVAALSGRHARFVRITVRGASGVNKVQARELVLYGAGVVPSPTPAPTPVATPPPTATARPTATPVAQPTPAPTPGPTPVAGSYPTPFDGLTPSKEIYVSPSGNDSNAGTSASPKRTLAGAMNAASAGTAIMLKSGTYTENVIISKSGTASAPIWIRSADGAGKATVARGTGKEPIRIHGGKNIIVEGLMINGGIAIYPASTTTSPDSAAVARQIVVRNNTIVNGWEDGIKSGQSVGLYLLNNDISRTASEQGIDLVAVNDSVIYGNYVHDITSNPSKNDGINVKGGSLNVLIENNRIENVAANGIFAGQSSGASSIWDIARAEQYEGKNITVRNNSIKVSSKRSIIFMGCHYCTAEKNTIGTSSASADVSLVASSDQHSPAWITRYITIKNNCIGRTNWLMVDSGQGTGLVNQNNTATGCK